MLLKVIFSACLVVLLLEFVLGAPNTLRKEQDLKKSFIEFLEQDQELSKLLEKATIEHSSILSRNIRQATENDNEMADVDVNEENPTKNSGFFDRAAKFVMEVLQRFLKWVNSDN